MKRNQQLARILFALGIASLGVLAFAYGHLGMPWYSVPGWVPWRHPVTYASAIILLGTGIGLLSNRTAPVSIKILLPYLLIWLLMRVPTLVRDPLTEVNWQNAGELAALAAGGWILFASLAREGSKPPPANEKNALAARLLFSFALIAFGLSHFVYSSQTAGLVPSWLPYHIGWAYLTGAGHLAAGLGVLFSVYPRLAATMEAGMLSVFTLVVWIPILVPAPKSVPNWTEILISFAITAGAWVMAASLRPD